ncbi:MAG: hypothetical protein K6C33_07920, partial [Desulfovibrio sp.]|nr:hypothetical protein [Desulfovibrio sp.]
MGFGSASGSFLGLPTGRLGAGSPSGSFLGLPTGRLGAGSPSGSFLGLPTKRLGAGAGSGVESPKASRVFSASFVVCTHAMSADEGGSGESTILHAS